MTNERFPKQEENERAGGQHGLQNKDGSASDAGAREPLTNAQLKEIQESAGSDDELGRGNDT